LSVMLMVIMIVMVSVMVMVRLPLQDGKPNLRALITIPTRTTLLALHTLLTRSPYQS
jgi:hypothetical protein